MASATTAGSLARSRQLTSEFGDYQVITARCRYPQYFDGAEFLTVVWKKDGSRGYDPVKTIKHTSCMAAEKGHDVAARKYSRLFKPKRKR